MSGSNSCLSQPQPSTRSNRRKPSTISLTSSPLFTTLSRSRQLRPSDSFHIMLLLNRILPLELVFRILSLASLFRRTSFICTRTPIAYRERRITRITCLGYYCSTYLDNHSSLSIPYTTCRVGDRPLRSVKFSLTYRPVDLSKQPSANVSFTATLLRGTRRVKGSDRLLFKSAMDGRLQSRSVSLGAADVDLVKMARAGDQIGVWVQECGGLGYGRRNSDNAIRTLADVREVSIECFSCW